MPRPKSKSDLLQQAESNFQALLDQTNELTDDQLCAPGIVGEWSIKDVLAHLTAWHRMCLGWYRAGLSGEVPKTPSEKYTWKQTPELNNDIWLEHRNDSLSDVRAALAASHAEIIRTIESISDEDLFGSRPFKWTKSTTLGAYMVSATSSHYDWARKEIRKGLKAAGISS